MGNLFDATQLVGRRAQLAVLQAAAVGVDHFPLTGI